MIIDLHTHTNVHSVCSLISPSELIQTYIDNKIDAVCITEHNILWDIKEQFKLIQKFEDKIKVFFGMEVDTEVGHILLFGSDIKKIDGMMRFNNLLKKINKDECSLIWAHPFRWESTYPVKHLLNEEFLSNFDAIELYNGNLNLKTIEYTKEMFKNFNLKFTGSSDTHSKSMACKYATKFNSCINNLQELIKSLKEEKYNPVIL